MVKRSLSSEPTKMAVGATKMFATSWATKRTTAKLIRTSATRSQSERTSVVLRSRAARPPSPSISTTGETKAKKSASTRPGITKKRQPRVTTMAAGMTAESSLPSRRKRSIQTSRHSARPPRMRSAAAMVSAPLVSGTMIP